VADAVATAGILAGPLQKGRVSTRELALVQARRWIPTAILQAVQRAIHARVIAVAVDAADRPDGQDDNQGLQRAVRLIGRTPALQRLAGYMMAIGPLPEHTPKYARRPG
jgi:hypothetical protein